MNKIKGTSFEDFIEFSRTLENLKDLSFNDVTGRYLTLKWNEPLEETNSKDLDSIDELINAVKSIARTEVVLKEKDDKFAKLIRLLDK